MKHHILFAALLAVLSAPGVVHAHDIVIVPSGAGQVTIRYGHPGDWLAVDAERLIDLTLHGTRPGAMKTRPQGLTLVGTVPRAGPSLVSVRYDNGLWVKTRAAGGKEHWLNSSRLLVPDGEEPMLSLKFAKGLVASGPTPDVAGRDLGHLLELIPQQDPASLRPGATLPVLVKFRGRPLPQAGVENSDLRTVQPEDRIRRYTTDANGVASVPVRRGVNTLAVDVVRPWSEVFDPSAAALPVERVMMVATYTFVR